MHVMSSCTKLTGKKTLYFVTLSISRHKYPVNIYNPTLKYSNGINFCVKVVVFFYCQYKCVPIT